MKTTLKTRLKYMMTASVIAVGLAPAPALADNTGQINPNGAEPYDSYTQQMENKYESNTHKEAKYKDPSLTQAMEDSVDTAYNKAGEIAQDVEEWGEGIFVGEMTFHKLEMGSNWIGLDVQSTDGEDLGEISDIIVSNGGTVEGFIVDYDVAFGLGGAERFVPASQLRVNAENNLITAAMTEAEYEALPQFSYDRSDAQTAELNVIDSTELSVARLMGADVKNANEETVGEIQDIRLRNGEVANVIATFDPSLMAEEKTLALDFDGITRVQTQDGEYLRLNVSQTQAIQSRTNSL